MGRKIFPALRPPRAPPTLGNTSLWPPSPVRCCSLRTHYAGGEISGHVTVSQVSPVAGGDLTSLCLPCSFILRCELGDTNCRVECLTSDSGFRCLRACLALKLLILVYVLFLSNVRVGRRLANLHWVWVGWFCSGLLPGQGLTPACSSVLMVELMESKLYWACVFFSLC